MSWSISVLENTLSLNDAQRAGLAPILERRGHAGDVEDAMRMFAERAPLIGFDEDACEHMDYLHDSDVQDFLKVTKAQGTVMFGSTEGDNKGRWWSYTFDGLGGLQEDDGRLKDLVRRSVPAVAVGTSASTGVASKFLSGKTIAFTGKLQRGTRKQWSARLEGFGAHVSSSVTSNTDLLITNETPGPGVSEKMCFAQRYHVAIMNEASVEAMIQVLGK